MTNPTKEEIKFIDKFNINTKTDSIFLAIKNVIDITIYSINDNKITIKKPDSKIDNFDIYYPKKKGLLYLVLDEVIVIFGKNFSIKSLKNFVGILDKLENSTLNILIPPIKDVSWFKSYEKRLKAVAKNMETFLGKEEKNND